MDEKSYFTEYSMSTDGSEWMDLPELVAALMNAHGAFLLSLLNDIAEAIYHQGTIYVDKALFVLPFLLQLLEKANNDEKVEVLGLVALLAEGCHTAISSAAQESAELKPLYRALCEGTPIYVAHLTCDESKVRALAAFLLGYCANTPGGTVVCLKTCYGEEHDEHVQFALVNAIITLHGYTGEELERLFASTTSKIVKYALSLPMVEAFKDELAPTVEEILAESLLDVQYFDEPYCTVAPYPASSTFATFEVLPFLGRRKSVTLLIRVIERWQYTGRSSILSLLDVIEQIFERAEFPNKVRLDWSRMMSDGTCEFHYRAERKDTNEQLALQDLSEEQYQALLCLLNCECFWQQRTNLLEAHSLPATKQALYEMLHIR